MYVFLLTRQLIYLSAEAVRLERNQMCMNIELPVWMPLCVVMIDKSRVCDDNTKGNGSEAMRELET
jgi:hypothetical protein